MVYQLAPVQISYGPDVAGKFRQGAADAETTAKLIEQVRLENIEAERKQQATDIQRGQLGVSQAGLGLKQRELGMREKAFREEAAARAANARAVQDYLRSSSGPALGAPSATMGTESRLIPQETTVGPDELAREGTVPPGAAPIAPIGGVGVTSAGVPVAGAPTAAPSAGLAPGQTRYGAPPFDPSLFMPPAPTGVPGIMPSNAAPYSPGLFATQPQLPEPAAPPLPSGFPALTGVPVAGGFGATQLPEAAPTPTTQELGLGAIAAARRGSETKRILETKPEATLAPPRSEVYLKDPPRATAEMQQIVQTDAELRRQIQLVGSLATRNPALLPNLIELSMKRQQLQTAYRNLEGLQAISNFELGDTQTLSRALSNSYGRNIQIVPTGTGRYNILADGQTVYTDYTPDKVVTVARRRLDTAFNEAEAGRAKEMFKMQLETGKQLSIEAAKRIGFEVKPNTATGTTILIDKATNQVFEYIPNSPYTNPVTGQKGTRPEVRPIQMTVPTR
jgi:hypothetical protein